MKTIGIFLLTLIVAFVVGLGVISLAKLSIQQHNPQKVIIEIKGEGIQIEKPVEPKAPQAMPKPKGWV